MFSISPHSQEQIFRKKRQKSNTFDQQNSKLCIFCTFFSYMNTTCNFLTQRRSWTPNDAISLSFLTLNAVSTELHLTSAKFAYILQIDREGINFYRSRFRHCRRRRRLSQRERQKAVKSNMQKHNSTMWHWIQFLVHFFAVAARLQWEILLREVLRRT